MKTLDYYTPQQQRDLDGHWAHHPHYGDVILDTTQKPNHPDNTTITTYHTGKPETANVHTKDLTPHPELPADINPHNC